MAAHATSNLVNVSQHAARGAQLPLLVIKEIYVQPRDAQSGKKNFNLSLFSPISTPTLTLSQIYPTDHLSVGHFVHVI